jgi:hypothetical protein
LTAAIAVSSAIVLTPKHAVGATIIVDDVVTSGRIERSEGFPAFFSVDYLVFDVAVGGPVTIDVLSSNVRGGSSTFLDIDLAMRLFAFDRSGDRNLLGVEIAANDDANLSILGGALGGADGSIDERDPFLLVPSVEIGTYVLALSAKVLSESEARSGINLFEGLGGSSDYWVTFGGIEPRETTAPVPLPAGWALLLSACALGSGCLFRRRAGRARPEAA